MEKKNSLNCCYIGKDVFFVYDECGMEKKNLSEESNLSPWIPCSYPLPMSHRDSTIIKAACSLHTSRISISDLSVLHEQAFKDGKSFYNHVS